MSRGAQIAPVGVDVLAEQRYLAHAVGGHHPNLRHQLVERAADLAAACRRHDAVRAGAVAADRDLQPALKLACAPRGQMAVEALELEVALSCERLTRQELGELVHLSGTEG